jgi:hypothetical protein
VAAPAPFSAMSSVLRVCALAGASVGTATCPDCSHCADRDQHAAMNINAIALSLLLTSKRPDHVNPQCIVRYDHLVPRPGQDRATW